MEWFGKIADLLQSLAVVLVCVQAWVNTKRLNELEDESCKLKSSVNKLWYRNR